MFFLFSCFIFIFWNVASYSATNRIDSEFTQWRMFLGVIRSPSNTWPRWPSQLAQTISTRFIPNEISVWRRTAPGISSSKEGQPQPLSNLSEDRYKGVLHRRQIKWPFPLWVLYSPVKARSVPLCAITCSSSGVSEFQFCVLFSMFNNLSTPAFWINSTSIQSNIKQILNGKDFIFYRKNGPDVATIITA